MLEFLKIFAYTILGIVAFGMAAMIGLFMIIMLWPLLLVAFPLAFIIYVIILLNKNKQNKRSKK